MAGVDKIRNGYINWPASVERIGRNLEDWRRWNGFVLQCKSGGIQSCQQQGSGESCQQVYRCGLERERSGGDNCKR